MTLTNEIDNNDIQIRLEAAKEALKRSRFAFFASTVVSLAIIITVYNATFSYYRMFPIKGQWEEESKLSPEARVTQQMQKTLMDEWVRSTTITISLLGIRIGVSDLAALGTLGLLIISIWFFPTVRRENRVIGSLLKATKKEPLQIRNMIFSGIVSYLVFADIGKGRYPIDRLDEPVRSDQGTPVIRFIVKALFFLPALAVGLIILSDILTLTVLPAPFRPDHKPLWHLLSKDDWAQVIVMESLALTRYTRSRLMTGI